MEARRLVQVAHRLIQAGAGQDMYRSLVTLVRRVLGRGVNTSFFLVYRSSDLVLPLAESTASGKRLHPEAYTQKITTGIIGHVVKTAETYYVQDVTRDPLFVSGGQTEGSELCVPVKVDGEVVGILNVESDRKAAFSPEVVEAVGVLAAVAGSLMNAGVAQEQLKATEAQLRAALEVAGGAERRFESLAAALDALVLVVDAEMRVTFANGAWKGAFAKSTGRELESILAPGSGKDLAKLARGGAVKMTLRAGKKDIEATGVAVRLAESVLLVLDPAPARKTKTARR